MKKMPWWKWTLLFIGGIIVFMVGQVMTEAAAVLTMKAWFGPFVSLAGGCLSLGMFGVWVWLLERKNPTEVDLKRLPKDMALGMGFGVAEFLIVTAALVIPGYYAVQSVQFPAMALFASFCFYFLVAVEEELVFRGILFRYIDGRFNTLVAIIVSGLLFGFVHMGNPGATVWSSVCIAVDAGILLGLAYKYTNTLWVPIGLHWAWNFVQGNVFGFAVSGNGGDKSIITPLVSGPEILNGGDFGPEASITAIIAGLLLSGWFYYKIRQREDEI